MQKIVSAILIATFTFSLAPAPLALALRIEAPDVSGIAGAIGKEINANAADIEEAKQETIADISRIFQSEGEDLSFIIRYSIPAITHISKTPQEFKENTNTSIDFVMWLKEREMDIVTTLYYTFSVVANMSGTHRGFNSNIGALKDFLERLAKHNVRLDYHLHMGVRLVAAIVKESDSQTDEFLAGLDFLYRLAISDNPPIVWGKVFDDNLKESVRSAIKLYLEGTHYYVRLENIPEPEEKDPSKPYIPQQRINLIAVSADASGATVFQEVHTANLTGAVSLSKEYLGNLLKNIGDTLLHVNKTRSEEEYDMVSIGGGSCAKILGGVAIYLRERFTNWSHAAIACSSDNGGLDAEMRIALEGEFGHTVPCGDPTNAIKAMLGEWEAFIYDTRAWEMTDERFKVKGKKLKGLSRFREFFTASEKQDYHNKITGSRSFEGRTLKVIECYIEKMLESGAPITPHFRQFTTEILNLARLVDKHKILISGQPGSALDIERASIRHATFYALMIEIGAYNNKIKQIDWQRFKLGVWLLQNAFGIEGRIAVPSLDYQELFASWHKKKNGKKVWTSAKTGKRALKYKRNLSTGGEVNIGLVPDVVTKDTIIGEFRLHPDLEKARKITACQEALEIIDQVRSGGIITIGPSSFIVSSGPSVLLLQDKLRQARRRGVRIYCILNATYNNETLTFKDNGGIRAFIDFLKLLANIPKDDKDRHINELIDGFIVNTDYGEHSKLLAKALQDKGDSVSTYKERGPVIVSPQEAREIERLEGIKIHMAPLVHVVFKRRKLGKGQRLVATPWAAHNPKKLADLIADEVLTLPVRAAAAGAVSLQELPGIIERYLSRGFKKLLVFVDMDGVVAKDHNSNVTEGMAEAVCGVLPFEDTQIVMLTRSNQASLDSRFLNIVREVLRKNNLDAGLVSRIAALPKAGVDKLKIKRPSAKALSNIAKRMAMAYEKVCVENGIKPSQLEILTINEEENPVYDPDKDYLVIVKDLEVMLALYKTVEKDGNDIRPEIIERLGPIREFSRTIDIMAMKTGRATIAATPITKAETILAYIGMLCERESLKPEDLAVIVIDDENEPDTVGYKALACVKSMDGLAVTIKVKGETGLGFVAVEADGQSTAKCIFDTIKEFKIKQKTLAEPDKKRGILQDV